MSRKKFKHIGAINCHWNTGGSYTAPMLRSLGNRHLVEMLKKNSVKGDVTDGGLTVMGNPYKWVKSQNTILKGNINYLWVCPTCEKTYRSLYLMPKESVFKCAHCLKLPRGFLAFGHTRQSTTRQHKKTKPLAYDPMIDALKILQKKAESWGWPTDSKVLDHYRGIGIQLRKKS